MKIGIGKILGAVVVVLVIVPVIVTVLAVRSRDPTSSPRLQARHGAASTATCAAPAARPPLVGVAPGPPWGRNLAIFTRATGVRPQIVVQYLSFGAPYDPAVACHLARAGGELLVQWDPMRVSLQQIANGGWDRYITRFARDVRAARVPIVLSFGHEMNGDWYPWGYTQASPGTFIAAWRHLHRLFAAAGAGNVTWCWDVNHWDPAAVGQAVNYGIAPAQQWWPGARYVNWIGLDAYYETPADTFGSLFRYSLKALHRIAPKPVLIAETAAAAGPLQARQIRSLFSGLRRAHIIGAVWFDWNGREIWRLEGHPAAIAAFRAGAKSLHDS
jgi:hypothetical protein